MRREFVVPKAVKRARLYVTAWGVYEVEVNGCRVGNEILAPGWTSYGERHLYQTFDVTALVVQGSNAIGAMLADGWFRGRVGFQGGVTRLYGERTALLAQLEITFGDGSTDVVSTDTSWVCSSGPIVSTGLYAGEHYDARRERTGWSSAGFDASGWALVEVTGYDASLLVAPQGPPIRAVEVLAPKRVERAPSGRLIVDFGQNISGRLRIRVQAPAGHTITFRHAEVLEDGELSLRPLRQAKALDQYVAAGRGVEEWEPRFTMHGFRYAELEGWPGDVEEGAVEAIVCHTDMRRTGWFECSDALLNRLHENIVWSMRGNFVGIPTDCPQRDERLGWTGDILAFSPAASFLYDCSGMLASWLADLMAEQDWLGTVPDYVPWVPLTFPLEPAAAWGDAAVFVPWTLYQRFGDLGILRAQYPSMKAWVDQIAEVAGERHLWDRGFQLGDWLDPTAPPDRPEDVRTDCFLVATAFHARSAAIVAEVATLLGQADDHLHYRDLARDIRVAFIDEFVTPSGRLSSDAPTAYALALSFDLLPGDQQRDRAGRRLTELVRAGGYRIGTGFVGTPLICDALSSVGADDVAYRLLMQQECPSWLYPVTMGATTVWERWDSLLSDGTVNPGDMTSFNHYAFGSVADWMHRRLVGLASAEPGYRRILVSPRPGGSITHAAAAHDTPYGRAAVEWDRNGQRLEVVVTVPPNTTATVRLPDPAHCPVEVGSGRHTFACKFRDPADDVGPSEPDPVDIRGEVRPQRRRPHARPSGGSIAGNT
jgi:alpha-L-rhamnosidase